MFGTNYQIRFIATLACGALMVMVKFGAAEEPKDATKWISVFDGKTLNGWKSTKFGGQGDVTVKDGNILLDFGAYMTGITYTKEMPKMNYEFRLEAMRVEGTDFFCGATFPVDDTHCSFIVGGWGGGIVGLSSIDDLDASENDTTSYEGFKNDRWYAIRVKVSKAKIEAWIDDKQMVDQTTTGKKVSTRVETDLSKPFGFATWDTKASLRKLEYRRLKVSP